jgi:membrane associated rhomboid family serine protease
VFPYRDENQTQRTPYITMLVIALNILVWLFVQGGGTTMPLAASICDLGLIPGRLTGAVPAGTRFPMGNGLVCVIDPTSPILHIFTSMFLHGSWLHLLGNMWFLWLFGNNVEDAMTRPRFLVFYLVSGVAAAVFQTSISPAALVPMVGASGAISGVMGAYLVLYPRVRVWTLVPIGFFLTSFPLPAWLMIIYWAVLQFAGGLMQISTRAPGGVASWAHIGGLIAGIALVKLFTHDDHVAEHRAGQWRPAHIGWR